MRLVLPALLFTVTMAVPAFAQTTQRFDGDWSVTLTCAATSDGTKGYIFKFPATVRGGQVHAEHGTRGQAAWLEVNGTIQPDGSANLFVRGLTDHVDYSVGRVPTATPYSYHAIGHFGNGGGDAQRVELRPCTLHFTR